MATSFTNRTALFHRAQPGGIAVIDDFTEHPGNIFFVDSGQTTTGSDAVGYGRNPDAPFVTLDYAVAQCTGNQGDVIYVMPGHAETRSTTGNFLALDVAGISVIGLGKGADRPTFTLSHTGAAATISAASVHLENVVFVAGIDSVTAPLTISAADCSLKDVEFRDTTDIEFVVGVITTADADRLAIDGFVYHGYAAGNACTIGISLVGVDGGTITNSIFYGEFSTACINFATTLCTDITVKDCVFYNDNVALTKNVVDTVTSSIWQVTDCYDGKGGYSFSGGSAAAVGSDDVSAIAALVGTSAESTQTSDLHGKIGTDAQMDNKSLYDILVTGGPTTAPSSAAPATTVGLYQVASAIYDDTNVIGAATSTQTSDLMGKIGTDAELGDRSLYDQLVGDGPVTAPASAAPANDVSLYEVLSAVYDDTNVIGAVTAATTDSVCGKIGTDAEMNDISLYDLLVGDGPSTAPSGATAGNDVSLYEIARFAQEAVILRADSTQTDDIMGKIGTDAEMNDISLYDLLVGDGPTTAPSAAAPGNDVSIYEIVRDIWDALRNGTGGSEPTTNYSVMDYILGTAGTYIPGYGLQVSKSCDLSGANDDLFTVTGKVMVTMITGQVESANLTGAESFQLRIKTSNEPLCAATTIDTDADGTMYLLTGDTGAVMNGADAPTANIAQGSGVPLSPMIIGQASGSLTIESNTTGNNGTIDFILYYYPLEASATVAAAA
jgi:hypothetical protein